MGIECVFSDNKEDENLSVIERGKEKCRGLDEESTRMAFGSEEVMRVFESKPFQGVSVVNNSITVSKTAGLQSDEEMARMLQSQENEALRQQQQQQAFTATAPPMPPPIPLNHPQNTPQTIEQQRQARIEARRQQAIEGGKKVIKGLGFAARLGVMAVGAMAKEGRRQYEEGRREREGQQQNIPTAVAYPVP